ncbi:uncharacterized protein JCM10292_000115 [Rhodotorula paludigena]|uniref:uncharacterized protein n=1 Tax=Rhodotorula paludigena TaxID=86838 RepID=UPI0031811DB2
MSATPSSSAPPSSASSSTANLAEGANPAQTEADRKRAHRAQKKAEQQARKDERKRFAQEQGIDPSLLPKAIAGELALNGVKEPKGFKPREWVTVPVNDDGDASATGEGRKVSIFSWNMLAQALVRRELFPGSDCLKGKDRLPALMEQVLYYSPDIAVLQEVDRLSEHLPSLTLTHGYTSYVGYRNKSHGLLIAHENSVFTKVGERGIRLDDLALDDSAPVSAPATPSEDEAEAAGESAAGSLEIAGDKAVVGGDDKPPAALTEKEKEIRARPPDAASSSARASRRAAGLSRTTRNVALFVALEFKDQPGRGVVVGTTHLFWHPSHVYERVRQTALLVKELENFRAEGGDGAWRDWPLFLAGDLNTQPRELTYRLLTGAPIPPDLVDDFERSRCVHFSVDKLHDPSFEPPAPPEPEAKEGEDVASDDLSQHPDRVIKNTRPATDEDGLATLEQLQLLFRHPSSPSPSSPFSTRRIRSAYGESYGLVPSERTKWYSSRPPEVQMGNGWRVPEPAEAQAAREEGTWDERVRRGDFEPRYSNFTPLWRCTLDYILLLPPLVNRKEGGDARRQPRWRELLSLHDFHETCEPGLPRKGVEPSDHVAVATVVELF